MYGFWTKDTTSWARLIICMLHHVKSIPTNTVLKLQIHLYKAYFSDDRSVESLHKSFLNQTTLDLREEKWAFLNREFAVYFFTWCGNDKLSSTCCEESFAKARDKGQNRLWHTMLLSCFFTIVPWGIIIHSNLEQSCKSDKKVPTKKLVWEIGDTFFFFFFVRRR